MRRATSSQGGFTLIEMSIALVLLMLGLMLATQVLMETSQLFVETAGEAQDTPVPLVIARIRNDVQGAADAAPILLLDGSLGSVQMVGGPDGQVIYEKRGTDLYRRVLPITGEESPPTILWRGVTAWSCQVVPGTRLLDLQVTYRRRTVPHTPLAVMPAYRGPLTEELPRLHLHLLPRGGGLGDTW